MDYRKHNHVMSELQTYAGPKKVLSDSTFVSCPYHSERTPSGRIFHSPSTKNPGYFKCYGCGQKASWDEVAPRLGLRPYVYSKPQELDARPAVRELEQDDALHFQHTPLPRDKKWRSISTNLLIDIGCTLIFQYNEKFIYMPVNVLGEEKGFIRARLQKIADKPSYLNKPGKWSERYGLFPYDYSIALMRRKKLNTLVLVEGPRDALRLLSNDIPACAILGTQSWVKRKGELVEIAGVEKVITCFDGDDAGIDATSSITEKLHTLVKTENFNLAGKDSPYHEFRKNKSPAKSAKQAGVELWDPCNMPIRKVKQLKSLIKL